MIILQWLTSPLLCIFPHEANENLFSLWMQALLAKPHKYCVYPLPHTYVLPKTTPKSNPHCAKIRINGSVHVLKFTPAQLARSVGTATASFDMNGGCQWIVCCPICKTPEDSSRSEFLHPAMRRSRLQPINPRASVRSRSLPTCKLLPLGIESRKRHHHRVPARPIQLATAKSPPSEVPCASGCFGYSPTHRTCQQKPSTRQRASGTHQYAPGTCWPAPLTTSAALDPAPNRT